MPAAAPAPPVPRRHLPLCGWGRLSPRPCEVYRPAWRGQLEALVTGAAEATVLARGLGRSYGDAAVNGGGAVLLQTALDRLIGFDPAEPALECEAGVSLGELLSLLVPRGFFLPVVPGTQLVTVGGAIAADVHGKNHHADGAFGRWVKSLTLLLADGSIVSCSASDRPELFAATVGGMGLTGVILSARLALRSIETAAVLSQTTKVPDLHSALAALEAEGEAHRYSVAWIDAQARGRSLGRCVLMRGEHARLEDLPPSARRDPLRLPPGRALTLPFDLPPFVLSPLPVRAFNALYYGVQRPGSRLVPASSFFFPLDALLEWNRMYGSRGFVQYQALLPAREAAEGLAAVLSEISRAGAGSFLAVLKRMGPEGDGFLSYARPGYTLALDLPNTGPALVRLVARLDEIVLPRGGRLYLAKDALMSAEAFATMYPRLGEFRAVRAQVDPKGRFSSDQARRLGLA